MNENAPKNKAERIPIWSIILLSLALVSGVILFFAQRNVAFALFFDKYISGPIRAVLAFLTNVIPFSLAELLILFLPIIITLLIIYAVKKKSFSLRAVLSYFVSLISCASVLFTLFVFSFGVGYHVPSLYDRFDIPNDGVDADRLRVTAVKLATQANLLSKHIDFNDDGSSAMPYSLDKMNDKLIDTYKEISKEFEFVQGFSSNIKPVLMSVPMSYSHTTGVYTFFTGEANLNVDFPDYTLPYTSAHELAHQRGISRENEANFIAFLVGINTDDCYIQYSTYLNMFEYVASALYSADVDMYNQVYAMLNENVKGEIRAYSKFYDRYRDSKVGEVSTAINNAYLVANGTEEGTRSYGLVVDLAVAYFEGKFDEK